jgi:hypothetical protein
MIVFVVTVIGTSLDGRTPQAGSPDTGNGP